ncbi:MAG: response regulator [Ignavibacteria bacterium]
MNLIFRSLKILIVEDEKIIAKDIEATIKRLGYESVGIVSNAEDAIKKAGEMKPGLVLMDITLKGGTDGVEAAKIINDTFDIPVVYLTAHQDEDTVERTMFTNSYGFITKPLDDRDINSAISAAIYRYDVENKLKEAEERYFRLTENAMDMILSQSLEDLAYNYVNRACINITGYAPADFYLRPNLIEEIVKPDWMEHYKRNFRRLAAGEAVNDIEFMIRHKSGEDRWLNQRSTIVKSSAGKPQTVEAIITNVTQRRLYEKKLEETTEKLRAYSNHLQKAREDERYFISREIHDQLGQDLTVLKMDISFIRKKAAKQPEKANTEELVKELTKINLAIDDIINKVRKIATDLRPNVLDKLGLSEAIVWHAGEFEKRTKIKCDTDLCDDGFSLGIEKSISMFRIVQETLTNIARHSGADKVLIKLENINGWLILTISDNGKGITNEEIERTSSLGIVGMKERALLFGGLWGIESEKGKFTKIEVKVPLDPKVNS